MAARSDRLFGDHTSPARSGEFDDILIAGWTLFDDNPTALAAILAEWTSERSRADRVRNISGEGGAPRANGNLFLIPGVTVVDDDQADALFGESDHDWFFLDPEKDRSPHRQLDDVFASRFGELFDDLDSGRGSLAAVRRS